jgi:hypothetical protein
VASDPATTGLGLWVDDTKVTADGATLAETSFETDEGGWTIGPPPAGTASPANGWERATEQFQEGPVVATDDTIYAAFGVEGIRTAAKRAEFMRGVLRHLGVLGGT